MSRYIEIDDYPCGDWNLLKLIFTSLEISVSDSVSGQEYVRLLYQILVFDTLPPVVLTFPDVTGVRFVLKLGQIGTEWDKSGSLKISFLFILAR